MTFDVTSRPIRAVVRFEVLDSCQIPALPGIDPDVYRVMPEAESPAGYTWYEVTTMRQSQPDDLVKMTRSLTAALARLAEEGTLSDFRFLPSSASLFASAMPAASASTDASVA